MKNSFILVGFILLFTNLPIMTFILIMPSKYRCPICHSDEIIEYETVIECPHCNRQWHKDFISGDIEEDNILSDNELEGFLSAFGDELKDPEKRKKFLESLKEDLH